MSGVEGQSPLLVSSVSLGPPQPGRIPNNVRFAQNGNLASNSPTDSAKEAEILRCVLKPSRSMLLMRPTNT